MTSEKLFDLLSFETELADVEILRDEELRYDASFIVAKLIYENGDTMIVPFIHYPGNDWIFTPCDWQGKLPMMADEIDTIDWRVNDTDTEALIFDGLPMLAPWQPDPEAIKISTRKKIGEQLKAARNAQGLTTRQLAEKCGIAYNHIARIEAGRYNVTIDTLSLIADALGIELKFG